MDEEKSIRQILDEYGKYTSLTSGTSMWPLLHHHRDNIIVVKPEERLKKYDVALYEKNSQYIMHRVCEVHDDHYIIIGDNLKTREYVTDDMICGKLIGFYKNGKRYIDLETNKLYKFYSRVWVALYPVRGVQIFFGRAVRFIERKLFKVEYN
ncbi:MAG: S24/S26 family peptidase [Eubacterium sp.]|nr:S24/S26 family peptidase [Eubacterium sp.]